MLEFCPGSDRELGEHLVEVVLDSAGAEEEWCADLGVRVAVGNRLCDLSLAANDGGLRGVTRACGSGLLDASAAM
jgi:hypothetical protein